MKLIRCSDCGQVIALWHVPLNCECGAAGGKYNDDGDTVTIWGKAWMFGVENRVLLGQQASAFPYPDGNGKVTRLEVAPD